MARVFHMTWVPSRRGWMKEYQGKKYAVSCSQLTERFGLPVLETKEGSYSLANRWWQEKKESINAANRPAVRPLLPLEDLAAASQGDVRAFDDPWAVVNVLFAQATRQLAEQHRQQAA